jgi:hypothetical protein
VADVEPSFFRKWLTPRIESGLRGPAWATGARQQTFELFLRVPLTEQIPRLGHSRSFILRRCLANWFGGGVATPVGFEHAR